MASKSNAPQKPGINPELYNRGRQLYLHGGGGPGRTHNAIFALGCFLWYGDQTLGVIPLPGAANDEARAKIIIDRLKITDKFERVYRLVQWRSKEWKQGKRSDFDPLYMPERFIEVGLLPKWAKLANQYRKNEAVARNIAALEKAQQLGITSIKGIAKLAGSDFRTTKRILTELGFCPGVGVYKGNGGPDVQNSDPKCSELKKKEKVKPISEVFNHCWINPTKRYIIETTTKKTTFFLPGVNGMKLDINDFEKLTSVSIPIDTGKLTMILGNNQQGKTSIFNAAAMILTGEKMPCEHPATKAKDWVNRDSGADKAIVSFLDDEGGRRSVVINAAKGKSDSDGDAAIFSRISCGYPIHEKTKEITGLNAKELASFIERVVKTEPTPQEVAAGLKEKLGWEADHIEAKKWLEMSKRLGFDRCETTAKDERLLLERSWMNLIGSKYTTQAIQNLKIADENLLLGDESPAFFESAKKLAQANHEKAIRADAITVTDMLQVMAKEAPSLQAAQDKVDSEVITLEAEINTTRTFVHTLGQACPKCRCSLEVRNGKIVMASGAAHVEKDAKVLAEKQEKLTELVRCLNLALDFKNRNFASLTVANEAVDKIRQAEAGKTTEKLMSVDEARAAIDNLVSREKAYKAKTTAKEMDEKIKAFAEIEKLFSPSGLRLAKKAATLKQIFEEQLQPLCKFAGCQDILIHPDMTITYGGGPISTVSGSEHYLINAILKVAFLRMNKENLVMFDEANILVDLRIREMFIKMLIRTKMTAIVCMAVTAAEQVPDLGKFGRRIWIENGTATDLSKELVTSGG